MRHGFLLIDKPAGITSHDAVAIVRRTLGEKDIGHLGTLDPAATGLLVLAVGAKALKVIELFKDLPKGYEAGIHFGAVSSTYDREGLIEEVSVKPGWIPPNHSQLQNVIADRFMGRISQVPPAHSAVHVGGERAYRKARQGRNVDIPPREVLVHKCDILSFDYPELTLSIRCGSGTYVRSLAHDLGQIVKFGAYLSSLRRTGVGTWSVSDAVAPDKAVWTQVLPLKDVLTVFPKVEITEEEHAALLHGRDLPRAITQDMFAWFSDLPIAILTPKEGRAHPRKVL